MPNTHAAATELASLLDGSTPAYAIDKSKPAKGYGENCLWKAASGSLARLRLPVLDVAAP